MTTPLRLMTFPRPRLGAAGIAAAVLSLGAGCIMSVSSSASEGDFGTVSSGDPPTSEGHYSEEGRPPSSDDTASADDGTTGSAPDQCVDAPNLLLDPGFERGPDNRWDQSSMLFLSVFCDASCDYAGESHANSGDWWVWFGGDPRPDVAWVSQRVVIDGDTASLVFHLAVRPVGNTAEDTFSAWIDDVEVLSLGSGDFVNGYAYTRYVLDVSRFADGLEHEVAFEARLSGNADTSFFLDDVSLQSCVEEPAASESTSGAPPAEDSGEVAGDSETSDGESGESATGEGDTDAASSSGVVDSAGTDSGGATEEGTGASKGESSGGAFGTDTESATDTDAGDETSSPPPATTGPADGTSS